jgi:IS30 family transposase
MNRKPGTHLTRDERCQIYTLLQSGKSGRAIAKFLGVHHSTISRELKRNRGCRGYRYRQANNQAVARRVSASQTPKKMTSSLVSRILWDLGTTQSSPEQIAGRLGLEGIKISHESIYRLIWADKRNGGKWYEHLRRRGKKYTHRGHKNAGRGCIPGRIDIRERPKIVDKKNRFGDFELDTIVGAKHAGVILTIVDRASKYTYLKLLPKGN